MPTAATVSTSMAVHRRGYATPHGPPPTGFRVKPLKEWDEEKEGTFDRLGRIFLMTEMARGMYVLLEQFFRAP
jgi:NADH dehydrogenase (ubiquinone) Fe-S protein 8